MKNLDSQMQLYRLEKNDRMIYRWLPDGYKEGQHVKLKSVDGWWKITDIAVEREAGNRKNALLSNLNFLK